MALPEYAEKFLRQLRQGLGSLGAQEREEIIAELRAHLLDRQAQGKTDLLSGFETAEDLAATFVSENALRGALAQGTSWALARALLISARDSIATFLLFLPLVLLQLCAFGFVFFAALKPFMPKQIGLWVGDGNFYVGGNSGNNPAVHEVLGWWGVPVLAISGIFLFSVSNRAMRALAKRRLRPARDTVA